MTWGGAYRTGSLGFDRSRHLAKDPVKLIDQLLVSGLSQKI